MWIVVVAIISATSLSTGAQIFVHFVLDAGRSATIATGLLSVWACLATACVVASRRYGTGNVRRDLGLDVEPADLLRGLGIAAGALACTIAVSAVVSSLGPKYRGSNASLLKAPKGDVLGMVILIFAAVIGAPFFEELFFRGLVQRTLESKLTPTAAAGAQAVLFGLVHFQVVLGWGNVGVILAVAVIGFVLGLAVSRLRRIGPTIVAHGAFNGFVAFVVYASRK